jgi:hypothetical protein
MENLKTFWRQRPWWMNLLLAFCAYMTFVYMPFDIFYKPVERDQEVWFGFMLTGWWAKATSPLHWLIYGFGFYGFLKMKGWMWPWASLYVVQVAIGFFVFSAMRGGWGAGVISGSLFGLLAFYLWRARPLFQPNLAGESDAGSVAE